MFHPQLPARLQESTAGIWGLQLWCQGPSFQVMLISLCFGNISWLLLARFMDNVGTKRMSPAVQQFTAKLLGSSLGQATTQPHGRAVQNWSISPTIHDIGGQRKSYRWSKVFHSPISSNWWVEILMVMAWATLNLLFYLFALVRFKDSPFEKSIKVTRLATELMSMSGLDRKNCSLKSAPCTFKGWFFLYK